MKLLAQDGASTFIDSITGSPTRRTAQGCSDRRGSSSCSSRKNASDTSLLINVELMTQALLVEGGIDPPNPSTRLGYSRTVTRLAALHSMHVVKRFVKAVLPVVSSHPRWATSTLGTTLRTALTATATTGAMACALRQLLLLTALLP